MSRLDQIVLATRRKLAEANGANRQRFEGFQKKAEQHSPRGFRRALEVKSKTGAAIIAELKKASPSRGRIRADFDAVALARELETAGAAALSVLTEEEFFQGSLKNLATASANTQLPCLRKDFILQESQLLEARANCADAVLLIAAALEDAEIKRLAGQARELQLDVLCEVHDKAELQRALDAGCEMIGVNARDLHTFHVDTETFFQLAEFIPTNVLGVAESGIKGPEDIQRLHAAGYRAFLVGESLMKAESPGAALRTLLASNVAD